ncbi:hypothetical protein CLOM_g7076 [Closterium sp. NIES-68]|nr:hypothetical protein CLOM_g7076 [Closterium sp. NIES-68]
MTQKDLLKVISKTELKEIEAQIQSALANFTTDGGNSTRKKGGHKRKSGKSKGHRSGKKGRTHGKGSSSTVPDIGTVLGYDDNNESGNGVNEIVTLPTGPGSNGPVKGMARAQSVLLQLSYIEATLGTASRRAEETSSCGKLLYRAHFQIPKAIDLAEKGALVKAGWKIAFARSLLEECLSADPHSAVAELAEAARTATNLVMPDLKKNDNANWQRLQWLKDREVDPIDTNGEAEPLDPLEIDYCEKFSEVNGNDAKIRVDTTTPCRGSRVRSDVQYPSGIFSARIKCPKGDISGLVQSYYLSSLEGSRDQDEIDFEFLGKDKWQVQTNYYVNGKGGREVLIPLGFDCSSDFHEYTIFWNNQQIIWQIDGKVVRVAKRKEGEPYPVKPSYVYASIWDASYVLDGRWSGDWRGWDVPYIGEYEDLKVVSPAPDVSW